VRTFLRALSIQSHRRKHKLDTGGSSYSGGRDQEDLSSKPARPNSSQDPISKNPNTKKGWWSGSRSKKGLPSKCEVLSSNSSAAKKKKKRTKVKNGSNIY
jgi:hypothetical protein